ncbi:unnamed protein product [Meloidogyne enterolobii]|uniref:Uncharacterized protein n=1 Tax=Meloidogyne enterolobii TaxID=390850 RepID=A0ACB1B1Y0_MELEN
MSAKISPQKTSAIKVRKNKPRKMSQKKCPQKYLCKSNPQKSMKLILNLRSKDKNPPIPNNKTLIYLLDDKIYIKNKEDFYKEIEPKGLTTQKYYLILWTNIFFKNEIFLGETKETINKSCSPPLRKIENKKYLEDLERTKNYLEKWKNEAEKLSSEYTSIFK